MAGNPSALLALLAVTLLAFGALVLVQLRHDEGKALAALKETQTAVSAAMASAHAGFWEIPFEKNAEGEYMITYDESFSKLFRVGHMKPFTTSGWSEYIAPILDVEGSPEKTQALHDFLREFDGKTEKVATTALLKFADGTRTYLKNSAQLVYNDQGEPIKMVGLCVDFSDRMHALEAANMLSETLLNSMQQMIYVAEIETDEVIFMNDVMMNAFSVPEDYVGKKYWELLTSCNIESVELAKEKLDKDPESAVTWEIYQPYLKKELSCIARYIKWIDGGTVCFRTYFDVSDIKRAERAIDEQLKQQQLMADIARSFISTTDIEAALLESLEAIGKFLSCYRVVLCLYDEQVDIIRNDYEWANLEAGAAIRPKVGVEYTKTKAFYPRTAVEKRPYAILVREDFVHHAHLETDKKAQSILLMPLYVDGAFFGAVEIFRSEEDYEWREGEIQLITLAVSTYAAFFSRQHIAENLVQALQAAEAANAAKSAFLANMSHEIRTPLNAIVGMTNIAMREAISPKAKESLVKVKSASDVLLDIINNVLDMSKIEAARLELARDYFELKEVLENLFNVVSVRANEKHQRITISVAKSVPGSYYGDALRLTQIMTNLIYNAIKFSGERKEIKVDIALAAQEHKRIKLSIAVKDPGVGINEEQMQRLFRPFEQGDQRTVRRYGGTGLGLAIAKDIAGLMEGDITAESTPGKGSTFTALLWLDVAPLQPKQGHVRSDGDEPLELQGKHILLVEDVAVNREIVQALLEPTHVQIDEAADGLMGVELFRQNPGKYGMILMDIQMPEMDGYSATREIRGMDNEIPIVAMTAHAFKEDVEKSMAAGMNSHIIKPIDVKVLYEKVRQYMA